MKDHKTIDADVRHTIERERAYQKARWSKSGEEPVHTVAEWILILQKLQEDARRVFVTGGGNIPALDEIRQIAATAIACLEQCGCPKRRDKETDRYF